MVSCSVLSSSKVAQCSVRLDYKDFRKSCRMQKFCHKPLNTHALQSLLLGKAGVKGTLLVSHLGQPLR